MTADKRVHKHKGSWAFWKINGERQGYYLSEFSATVAMTISDNAGKRDEFTIVSQNSPELHIVNDRDDLLTPR